MQLKRWTRLPLAAVCGLAAAAVIAPAAQAQYPDPLYDANHDQPCEQTSSLISGIGASFQRTAQLGWGAEAIAPDPAPAQAKGFGYEVCSAYKLSGDGGTKKVQYSPAGSGAGRTAFGAVDTAGASRNLSVDFGGSDDPPTATQIANANEGPNIVAGPDSDDGILHTIPIAQGADAVDFRVPDGCEIPTSGPRSISRGKLEHFFRADSTSFDQWGELVGYSNIKASAGSGLTDAQCGGKKPKRVVRLDNSGTTFIFKQYLQSAAAGAFDWREPAGGGTLANNAWPNDSGSTAVVRGAANGNGPLLDALSAQGTNGGIGYADLGASRGRGYGWDYSGGTFVPTDRTFWVYVQHISTSAYVSPAKTNDQLGTHGARCTNVTYSNQPADTEHSWYNTTAVETSTDYPICGLTYALEWDDNSNVGINSQSRSAGRRDYLGYELDRPGLGTTPPGSQCDSTDSRYGKGQCKLPVNDYARLPHDVFTKARAGAFQLGP
jgi:ABC-type phosphate transport system substrate-binding protein